MYVWCVLCACLCVCCLYVCMQVLMLPPLHDPLLQQQADILSDTIVKALPKSAVTPTGVVSVVRAVISHVLSGWELLSDADVQEFLSWLHADTDAQRTKVCVLLCAACCMLDVFFCVRLYW